MWQRHVGRIPMNSIKQRAPCRVAMLVSAQGTESPVSAVILSPFQQEVYSCFLLGTLHINVSGATPAYRTSSEFWSQITNCTPNISTWLPLKFSTSQPRFPIFPAWLPLLGNPSGGLKSINYQIPISNSFGKRGHKTITVTISW